MTIEELRVFNDFLKMKYQSNDGTSIREILKCCDIIYPEAEWLMEEHKLTQNNNSQTELEFCIEISEYFDNIYSFIAENTDSAYHDYLQELADDDLYYWIDDFMKENAPKRSHYTTVGQSGKVVVVVKHKFNLPHVNNYSTKWDDYSRREKLELIQYYGISIYDVVSTLDEFLFWYDFERELEEIKNSLQSEELSKDYFENYLKDAYKEQLQDDHDKLEELLTQVSGLSKDCFKNYLKDTYEERLQDDHDRLEELHTQVSGG